MNKTNNIEDICIYLSRGLREHEVRDEFRRDIRTQITQLLEGIKEEIEEIIVDSEGLSKLPIGSVELHTRIGGNAGTRRAAQIITHHMQ